MKGFGEFVKTCILGGFLGVLPILLAVFVLAEAIGLLGAVTDPLVELLPVEELGREKTILLSTHILAEVQETCPRVIILAGGRIVADGTPEEIARCPSHTGTALLAG